MKRISMLIAGMCVATAAAGICPPATSDIDWWGGADPNSFTNCDDGRCWFFEWREHEPPDELVAYDVWVEVADANAILAEVTNVIPSGVALQQAMELCADANAPRVYWVAATCPTIQGIALHVEFDGPGVVVDAWATLRPLPEPPLGDFDSDYLVGLSDLARLLQNYGVTDAADMDGDGDTDLNDLAGLLANFGDTCAD